MSGPHSERRISSVNPRLTDRQAALQLNAKVPLVLRESPKYSIESIITKYISTITLRILTPRKKIASVPPNTACGFNAK